MSLQQAPSSSFVSERGAETSVVTPHFLLDFLSVLTVAYVAPSALLLSLHGLARERASTGNHAAISGRAGGCGVLSSSGQWLAPRGGETCGETRRLANMIDLTHAPLEHAVQREQQRGEALEKGSQGTDEGIHSKGAWKLLMVRWRAPAGKMA